jgi:Cyclic nucleotide-binding domain
MPHREWLRKAFPHLAEPALSETQRHIRTLRFPAGETVVREGDSADRFYIIKEGEVAVTRRDRAGREAALATLGPGQFFGEMGLLEDAPRTASVHAKTDLEVLALDREAFRRVVEQGGGEAAGVGPLAEPGREDRPGSGGASWEGAWEDAVRSACHTLIWGHGAIQSIDLTGQRWARADPGRLLRLTGLARRAATEYGLEVRVGYTDDRPVLHIAARPSA